MFEKILRITNDGTINTKETVICMLFGLLLGLIIAVAYAFISRKGNRSLSLFTTLLILPAVVGMVIVLVGSNTARALSIAGVFALVRFRSAPAEGKDILLVFLSMAVGLASGLGFLSIAFATAVIISLSLIIVNELGEKVLSDKGRELKILIPENMDYEDAFTDIFAKYKVKAELTKVKTTNMGTLYELSYHILAGKINEKAFLDELRIRNGNLNITLSRIIKKDQAL